MITDIVRDVRFVAYDEFLREFANKHTEELFRKPCHSDEFRKDLRYKIGYIQAVKDILALNEEARNE